jgi:hypothetical protein
MMEKAFWRTRDLLRPVLFGVLAVFLLVPFPAGAEGTAGAGDNAKPAVQGRDRVSFDSIKRPMQASPRWRPLFTRRSLSRASRRYVILTGTSTLRDRRGSCAIHETKS